LDLPASDLAEEEAGTRRGSSGAGADSNGLRRSGLAQFVLDAARSLVSPPDEAAAETPPLFLFLTESSAGRCLLQWLGVEAIARWRGDPKLIKAALDRDIAAIDDLLTEQLNAIIHHERFQALEASWRGIDYLVRTADGVSNVKVRILAASWGDVVRDLERAPDFDQSELFDKIYSQEFGMPGGEPFGLIVGDYYLGHRRTPQHLSDDISALQSLAAVAAASFAPFVAGCDSGLLGLESFQEFTTEIDLDTIFQQAEYTRWRSLRTAEDCRFIGLCLPKVLIREPWRDAPLWPAGFRFRETREQHADRGYLWGNASFAFAAIAIRAFGQAGWFAELRGARRGALTAGLVTDLPVDHFTTDRPDIAIKQTVEVAISDRQERQLGDYGLITLSAAEYTPYSVFYSNPSILQPQRHATLVPTINARLSSMLQYILCIGRFAHAIKVIGRDRVGSFSTAEECQTLIQNWLTEYVTANPNASLDLRIRYPLREGRVVVTEAPGRPGIFRMEMYLRPHLQLDDISTGIRLTTVLARGRAA
jgi:type VI secretion system ImpC/EvpB family protein